MSLKVRITREVIVDAVFQMVRKIEFERITAQTVAEELRCCMQPIMYNFKKVEDLRTLRQRKQFNIIQPTLFTDPENISCWKQA